MLFGAVALVGVLASRLRQSVIPFYIGAGILLNPYVAGRVAPYALEETEFVEIGAELGIVFLLLFLGFEFNLHVQELEELLEPVRDLFTAVFFFWFGLITDPMQFGPVLGIVAAAVVVTTSTKLVSGYLGGRIYDLDVRRSTRVGLGMTTRGEFSLIIATVVLATAGRLVPEHVAESIYSVTVGYVLVTSILGTILMQYSSRIESLVLGVTG